MSMTPKFNVTIYVVEKAPRLPKEVQDSLKGVVRGKMLKRMKIEAVDCPVLGRQVPFLECFICPNHIRRFKGVVDCAGAPLPPR